MAHIDESVYLAQGVVVTGDVTLEEGVSIWPNAVLRGDAPIRIGRFSNVQDNCTVHVLDDAPVSVGEYTSVGHNAILHGCTVGSHTLIGMGAIVMNRAKVGDYCLIGAGSLVTEDTVIPDGTLAFGSPARVRRELTDEEKAGLTENARWYVDLAEKTKTQEAAR